MRKTARAPRARADDGADSAEAASKRVDTSCGRRRKVLGVSTGRLQGLRRRPTHGPPGRRSPSRSRSLARRSPAAGSSTCGRGPRSSPGRLSARAGVRASQRTVSREAQARGRGGRTLAHLQDRDAGANDEEAHDDGDDAERRRLESLVQDLEACVEATSSASSVAKRRFPPVRAKSDARWRRLQTGRHRRSVRIERRPRCSAGLTERAEGEHDWRRSRRGAVSMIGRDPRPRPGGLLTVIGRRDHGSVEKLERLIEVAAGGGGFSQPGLGCDALDAGRRGRT